VRISGSRTSKRYICAALVVLLLAGMGVLAAPLQAARADDPLVRNTKYGPVKGKPVTGVETAEEKVWAWLGVPYAKPPVGELRWRAPQDPDPWAETRVTDQFGPGATQFNNMFVNLDYETYGQLYGNEDCLYLNVWRPRTTQTNLPVLFWIHGGANAWGESATRMYDGANFAARSNMVFVSLNYRLGTMGWFASPYLRTGDKLDDSGNYGALDIIKALKWVNENIANFGGNPGNVTIAGQSAGGINVHSMLVSPLAKGLFHRAIAMSGGPLSVPRIIGESSANSLLYKLLVKDGYAADESGAKQVADEWGNTKVAQYLRGKSAAELYGSGDGGGGFMSGTAMVYDDGYVIPMQMLLAESLGLYTKVPTILSSTYEELKLFLPLTFSTWSESDFGKIAKEMDIDSPQFDNGDTGIDFMSAVDPALQPLIPGYNALARSLSFAVFRAAGVIGAATAMSTYQRNIYSFNFKWDDEPKPIDFLFGSAHALDIPFMFHNFDESDNQIVRVMWPESTRASREQLANLMMKYVANFCRTGNPNSWGLPYWGRWSPLVQNTMIFDTPYSYLNPLPTVYSPTDLTGLEWLLEAMNPYSMKYFGFPMPGI
jgi:para-nitrobenzyl esterase